LVKHITHIITDNVDKVGKLSTDDDIWYLKYIQSSFQFTKNGIPFTWKICFLSQHTTLTANFLVY
jgi:hypothetical protein